MSRPAAAFVFSNLAMSLDGKIATAGREPFQLGTEDDLLEMQRLRRRCDAVVMGAGTLRTFRRFCGLRATPSARQPLNAVVSQRLDGIDPELPFFRRAGVRRVLFVTGAIPARRRAAFEATSQVIRLARPAAGRSVAHQVVENLRMIGTPRILVEGGGGLMWDFAHANLIDEYHVTLTPRILGGTEAPTLVDGPGFAPADALRLRLQRVRRLGDELYLVYGRRPEFTPTA